MENGGLKEAYGTVLIAEPSFSVEGDPVCLEGIVLPPLRFQGEDLPHRPRALSDDQGQFERERVVMDTLGLFTVKNLKIGLEAEGRAVSGLKEDLVKRLGVLLGGEPKADPQRGSFDTSSMFGGIKGWLGGRSLHGRLWRQGL